MAEEFDRPNSADAAVETPTPPAPEVQANPDVRPTHEGEPQSQEGSRSESSVDTLDSYRNRQVMMPTYFANQHELTRYPLPEISLTSLDKSKLNLDLIPWMKPGHKELPAQPESKKDSEKADTPEFAVPPAPDKDKPAEAERPPGPISEFETPPPPDRDKPAGDKPPGDKPSGGDKTAGDTSGLRTEKIGNTTVTRDSQNRVTEVRYPDGKVRSVVYGENNQITDVTIQDAQGKRHYTRKGTAWEGKDEQGRVHKWDGDITMGADGTYSITGTDRQTHAYDLNNKETVYNADEKPRLAKHERLDGTTLESKVERGQLTELIETSKKGGQETKTTWSHKGNGVYQSDGTPPQTRRSMSIDAEGRVRWRSEDGVGHTMGKDSVDLQEKSGTTFAYKDGLLLGIKRPNGDTRAFAYENGQLTGIRDKTRAGQTTWTRKPGSNVWSDGKTEETRDGIRFKDGHLGYFRDGKAVIEDGVSGNKIELLAPGKPEKVTLPSGSERSFKWDGDKLASVTDTVKDYKGKTTTTQWTREGDSDKFTAPGENGQVKTRFNIQPKASGDYSYKDSEGNQRDSRANGLEAQARGEHFSGSENMQDARIQLTDAARRAGVKMERFEGYMQQLEGRAGTYKLTPEQITKTYDNITQILTSPQQSPYYTQAERVQIAEQTLHNLARPTAIDQGQHPTCNVTTVEVYAAARHPEAYSDLVKQIALTGEYKSHVGTVHPPKSSLMAGANETKFDLDQHSNTDCRNRPSQIVQNTLVNGMYETGQMDETRTVNGQKVKVSHADRRYIMVPQTTHEEWDPRYGRVTVTDSEDRLVEGNGQPVKDRHGRAETGPGISGPDVLKASELMLGYKMPYVGHPYQIEGRPWTFDLPDSDRLLKAKADGKFPMGVHTMGGQHVQTIHDVAMKDGNCWVLIDNQHGQKKDGWIPLSELHASQQSFNAAQNVQAAPGYQQRNYNYQNHRYR